jgi:hypothetical protein
MKLNSRVKSLRGIELKTWEKKLEESSTISDIYHQPTFTATTIKESGSMAI